MDGMKREWKINSGRVRTALCNGLLSVFIVVVLCIICSTKAGYNVDELYSFGLANHQYEGDISPSIEEGVIYSGWQLWQEYLTVSEGHAFDYENVWENQAADVHPPLYYALIHTICSFFPSSYSIWMGLTLNIALAVIVFWQMVWLFDYFIHDRRLAIAFALLFLFSMGFVNNVAFIRMYVLLTVWTNALVMLFCRYSPRDEGRCYYSLLIVILSGGMMTQYYFLIFACFLCLAYGILLIKEKRWKKLLLSVCSAFVSFCIATALFEPMWTQIFSGYRGTQSFDNLTEKNLWESLQIFLKKINLEVYGNLFLILVLLAVLLRVIIWALLRKENAGRIVAQNAGCADKNISEMVSIDLGTKDETCSVGYMELSGERPAVIYWTLLLPTLCYIILIAKISPYDNDRYVMNVMGILYLLMFVPLIWLAGTLSKKAATGILLAAVLVLLCSYQNGVPYLYRSEEEKITVLEGFDEDIPCLYLYNERWQILPNYQELISLEQIEFVQKDNLEVLSGENYQTYDELVVFVGRKLKAENVLEKLIEQNPGLDTYTKLFKSSYATVYFLE